MKTSNNSKMWIRRHALCFFLAGGLAWEPACTQSSLQPASMQQKINVVGSDGDLVVHEPGTVLNRYAALAADAAAGDTSVVVSDISQLATLAPGDLLMIIQMQGAQIDTTDGPSYGNVTSLNNAGNHELVTVASINGNTIGLTAACRGLMHSYSMAGQAQVIRVPQAASLTVTGGGSITAKPWDGQTGGVAAIHVQGSAVIDGSIDVSHQGFRPGQADTRSQPLAPGNAMFASGDAAAGAEKGEGIAGSASDYDAMQGRYGRGAPANGGGGANSFGSGGGGGANANNGQTWSGAGVMDVGGGQAWSLDPAYGDAGGRLANSSGGGRGGYSLSVQAQDPMSIAPGDASWGGDGRQERGGRGGRPLPGSTADRLFMGGGGGAADSMGAPGGRGGAGGGIVYLVAHEVSGSGSIAAHGEAGEAASDPQNLGSGGGGGGGGSVVIRTGSAAGPTVGASGGAGGSQQQSASQASGPGGGGGGGFIATFQVDATTQAGGGSSGLTASSTMMAFTSNGATNGGSGSASQFQVPALGSPDPLCVPADVSLIAQPRRGEPVPGSIVVYPLTVANRGGNPAYGTHVSAALPPQILDASWTCSSDSGAVSNPPSGQGSLAAIMDLPAGSQMDCALTLTIPASATDALAFSVSAIPSVTLTDTQADDNVATVYEALSPQANLAVSILPPDGGTPGHEPYLLRVQNLGMSSADSVTAKLKLPDGIGIESAGGDGWTCAWQAPELSCNRPSLSVGNAPDIGVQFAAGAASSFQATATVASSTPDPIESNNQQTADIDLSAQRVSIATPDSGFGCSAAGRAVNPGPAGWVSLLGLVALLRRRLMRRA